MKNAKKEVLYKIVCFVMSSALLAAQALCLVVANTADNVTAMAENAEVVYCDTVYSGDEAFSGQGTQVSATYDVYYDYKEVVADVSVGSVPSYGNTNTSLTNTCGPLAGTNLVVYYDRYCPNLIAGFEPGVMFGNGVYNYYPDMNWTETTTLISTLYTMMKVPEVGGTTSPNFRSALDTYAGNAGYDFSYSSFYSSATTVNLSALLQAINANKVGVVMCSTYNFVFGFTDVTDPTPYTHITKITSSTAHMMMVYGYTTIAYYQDGVNFRTDTFLKVCSCLGTTDIGYMQLNDYSTINEALIITIE